MDRNAAEALARDEHRPATRSALASGVAARLVSGFDSREDFSDPFRHWIVRRVFPGDILESLRRLPTAPAPVDGPSGKRELRNETRRYFDVATNARIAACGAVADAFQSARVVAAIEGGTAADLSGTCVRIEYAQDTNGFWLEPHTDLGVKRLTMQIYMSAGAEQGDLGTDLYSRPGSRTRRIAFEDNSALIFVPGPDTWHGLERRPIVGVRRSIIVNYVTGDWLAREQLACPASPVRA
ncbi:MAG: hypothetical protein ABI376_10760 [Caulobacteraceae bacterium]